MAARSRKSPEKPAKPKASKATSAKPKTAVGKIFKPDLRKRAIKRVFDDAFGKAGVNTHVTEVVEDKKRGLVARIAKADGLQETDVSDVMGNYATPWEWADS